MSFASFISRKLSLRTNGKWNPSMAVAVGGIAMSFVVMLLSVAVVIGFKNEIRRKIMGFDAQITVSPVAVYGDNEQAVSITPIVGSALAGVFGDTEFNATVSLQQPGLIKTDDNFMGVVFKSFSESYNWNFERDNLVDGELPIGDNYSRGMLISKSIADKLSLKVGDRVNVYFFINGSARPRKFDVIGIYCSYFGDYDDLMVYVSNKSLTGLMKLPQNYGQRIEIRGIDEKLISDKTSKLQSALNKSVSNVEDSCVYAVSNVYSSGASYFNWLDMLDTNIVVILVLMGCVSGFMLISCVLIMILERVKMVGILKSLGANDSQISSIFIQLGLRVVGLGLLIGNIIALGLIFAQYNWHLIHLDPEAYYLSYVPVMLSPLDFILINAGCAIVSFALMLIPTRVVGKLSPVKVLHFE